MGGSATISLEESTERLRARGMKISVMTLRAGLAQKAFPFGTYIDTTKHGAVKRTSLAWVYPKLLDKWMDEHL